MRIERPLARRRAAVTSCVLALCVAGAASAAPPQTVYRCGPDGRVYSQTPCADGRPVTIDDPRSAQQQQQAARDTQLADQLARERKQREAAAKGQAAAGFKTSASAEPASAAASRPKAKSKPVAQDTNMSPPMRAPAQALKSP
jgi:hypothetical protein